MGAHSPYRTGSKILCARAEGPGDAPRTGTAGAGQGQQRWRRRRRRSGEGSRSRSRSRSGSGKGSEQAAVKVTEPAGAREQARAQIVARQEEGQGMGEKRLRFSALSVVFNNNARHKMHVLPRKKNKRRFRSVRRSKASLCAPSGSPGPRADTTSATGRELYCFWPPGAARLWPVCLPPGSCWLLEPVRHGLMNLVAPKFCCLRKPLTFSVEARWCSMAAFSSSKNTPWSL